MVHTEILLPDNAPREYADRSTLWNAFEDVEKSKNAQLSREIEIALPNELSETELTSMIPYGYKKSETDKNVWEIDKEAAEVVRKIFQLCIDGYGPTKIARILTEDKVLTPTAYAEMKKSGSITCAKPYRWSHRTIGALLEKLEYIGHTVNFRTRKKSYKCKKKIENPKEDWAIFENTHEAIISKEDFDLVQELRKNKRKLQHQEEVNPFSELDKLFTRLYEDNVSGKISDERFEMMSKNYEAEHKELRQIIPELSQFIEAREQKNADTAQFIGIVRKYSEIPKLTPEIMHEFIEKIVVYAPDSNRLITPHP